MLKAEISARYAACGAAAGLCCALHATFLRCMQPSRVSLDRALSRVDKR